MRVNFITTNNRNNGYGMTREYFLKYMPRFGVVLEPPKSGNEIDFILHVPPAIEHSKAPVKVLYTMIEGDTVPDSWKPYLDTATHILVPSKFCQEVFERAGYKAHHLPLGYDPELFVNCHTRLTTPFTFLHYEAFQDRKGWRDLLDAWLLSGLAEQEFDCQLILKTVKPFSEIVELTQDLFIPYNVKIVVGELPHHCLFDLLKQANCFVFPSHGEGFSLPPIEAMATGLPVIISNGHSHTDYYNEDYMYGVPCDIKIPARYQNWEDQGNFVRCNVDNLARVLKHVYENPLEAQVKGQAAVEYISKYAYDRVVQNIAEFLHSIDGNNKEH